MHLLLISSFSSSSSAQDGWRHWFLVKIFTMFGLYSAFGTKIKQNTHSSVDKCSVFSLSWCFCDFIIH